MKKLKGDNKMMSKEERKYWESYQHCELCGRTTLAEPALNSGSTWRIPVVFDEEDERVELLFEINIKKDGELFEICDECLRVSLLKKVRKYLESYEFM